MKNQAEQEDQNKKAANAQADGLRTWGGICNGARDGIRRMIIGRLVERIDAEEGNRITINYRISSEPFMNREHAGA